MLEELKAYLSAPPLLSKPEAGEELYLYLVVSPLSIGSILVWEEGQVQKPVYYISKVLQNTKTRYTWLEKLIFTLITWARKLCPYFQTHTMVVLMDQPLKTTLYKSNTVGMVAKWALELTKFDLVFLP